jgi:hypothetical protein
MAVAPLQPRGRSRAMTWERGSCRAEPSVELAPKSRSAVPPHGWGRPLRRPTPAHLRGTAPRSSRPKGAKRVRSTLTAVQPMRYGSLSGVCALVAGVVILTMRGGVVVQLASARRRGSTVKVMRVRSTERTGSDSCFRTGSSTREADGSREGRRVSRASEIGARGSDHRAGSLVRRCKGCRAVVSSREVPGSG